MEAQVPLLDLVYSDYRPVPGSGQLILSETDDRNAGAVG